MRGDCSTLRSHTPPSIEKIAWLLTADPSTTGRSTRASRHWCPLTRCGTPACCNAARCGLHRTLRSPDDNPNVPAPPVDARTRQGRATTAPAPRGCPGRPGRPTTARTCQRRPSTTRTRRGRATTARARRGCLGRRGRADDIDDPKTPRPCNDGTSTSGLPMTPRSPDDNANAPTPPVDNTYLVRVTPHSPPTARYRVIRRGVPACLSPAFTSQAPVSGRRHAL